MTKSGRKSVPPASFKFDIHHVLFSAKTNKSIKKKKDCARQKKFQKIKRDEKQKKIISDLKRQNTKLQKQKVTLVKKLNSQKKK